MNPPDINRHTFPPGGWIFIQPQTNWKAPTPTSTTFEQTVILIIKHRHANPAIAQKYNLSTNKEVVAGELENFTRKRLRLPEVALPKTQPPLRVPVRAGGVPVAAGNIISSTAQNILRAAQGTGVVLDWLNSGGNPVAPDLAAKRAAICVVCPQNRPGDWYTVAPATVIKEALEARKDLKLETPHDDKLQSCQICRCLMRLKVHTPLEHILAKTKPQIMAEFPSHCWIARRDQ